MAAVLTPEPMPAVLSSQWIEDAPLPIATVEGDAHTVRDINAAFCRLLGRARGDLVGKPFCDLLPHHECLALLDSVYRTGTSATLNGQDHASPGPVFSSYLMWPAMVDGRAAGVVIQ